MNYATIKNCDIANGPGIRISLFVSGCTHRCKGCFNEVAWDFDYGQPFTQQTIDEILSLMEPPHIAGITILGGEPFEPQNQPAVLELLRQIKAKMPGLRKIDGDFGIKTQRAVVCFQFEHSLEVDGIAGPQTQAALCF